MGELVSVLRDYNIDPGIGVFNLPNFKYLHVVPCHIISQRKGTHIDHIHIRVLYCEQSRNLSIFPLQKLLHADAFHLAVADRVNVDLYPAPFFYLVPLDLEFFLHLSPEHQRVHVDVFHSLLCLLLEKEQAEAPLDDGGFLHEEAKLAISRMCLIHAPILLDGDRGQFGTLGTLKHA